MNEKPEVDLQSKPAAMVMTLEITRAATGITETVEVICTPIEEPIEGESK